MCDKWSEYQFLYQLHKTEAERITPKLLNISYCNITTQYAYHEELIGVLAEYFSITHPGSVWLKYIWWHQSEAV